MNTQIETQDRDGFDHIPDLTEADVDAMSKREPVKLTVCVKSTENNLTAELNETVLKASQASGQEFNLLFNRATRIKTLLESLWLSDDELKDLAKSLDLIDLIGWKSV